MNGSEYRSLSWLPHIMDDARGELYPSIAQREEFRSFGNDRLTQQGTPIGVRPVDDGEDDEDDWEDDWDDEDEDEDEDDYDEDDDWEDEDEEEDWEEELDEDEYEDEYEDLSDDDDEP